jgi:hypothetical protein
MENALHVTSGDIAGDRLARSGIAGEVLVWHDVLYDGPRQPGWPAAATLRARARFLADLTGGGLKPTSILQTLEKQYARLAAAANHTHLVLWFDACLFDQSMLAHLLACLDLRGIHQAELLVIDAFPGIVPYHGIGQLSPTQLASVYDRRKQLTDSQFEFARLVDKAFADQDMAMFAALAHTASAPLPWVPAAVRRWLEEQPDPATGLRRLEGLALDAVRRGRTTPPAIHAEVAAAERPPRYWGDITLWAAINALAARHPPLVRIAGPLPRLPQWEGIADLTQFRITPS